jgi:beta-phosphoglucomutase-like phosphatase (HAD superfamily)
VTAAADSASPFAAVIFDCDGVLVDSEVLALEVELDELAALGLDYDRDEFCARFMGLNNPAFYAALDADRRARLGEGLPDSFAVAHRARLWRAYETRLLEVEGAGEAVAACRSPRAVASSSGGAMLELKLKRTGLWPLFDPHVYGGDKVKRAKPAPDIFLLAAAGLGAEPAACLVLEDTENGVAAARAAGMTVWAFCGGGHMGPADAARLRAAGAQRTLSHWREARALFDAWGRQAGAGGLEAAGLFPA